MELGISDDLLNKIGIIATERGISPDHCLKEAILQFVEDYEDSKDSEKILADPNQKTYSSEEVLAHIHRKDI